MTDEKTLLEYLEKEYTESLGSLNVFGISEMSNESRLEYHSKLHTVWKALDQKGYRLEIKFVKEEK